MPFTGQPYHKNNLPIRIKHALTYADMHYFDQYQTVWETPVAEIRTTNFNFPR